MKNGFLLASWHPKEMKFECCTLCVLCVSGEREAFQCSFSLFETDVPLPAEVLLNSCRAFLKCLRSLRTQVLQAFPEPPVEPCHSLEAGDWLYVKVVQWKDVLQPRWKAPQQVPLITNTAGKHKDLPNGIGASQCKRVPAPEEKRPLLPRNTDHPLEKSPFVSQSVSNLRPRS